jgi:hypothetical protein
MSKPTTVRVPALPNEISLSVLNTELPEVSSVAITPLISKVMLSPNWASLNGMVKTGSAFTVTMSPSIIPDISLLLSTLGE